jgi:hypothetical protein
MEIANWSDPRGIDAGRGREVWCFSIASTQLVSSLGRCPKQAGGSILKLPKALTLAMLLAGICPTIGFGLTHLVTGDGHGRSWGIAACIALAISIPSLLVSSSVNWSRLGAGGPLLIVAWRLGSYLAVLMLVGATKWPGDNFFAQCLLGCYFPFLVLESGFSILRSSPPPTRE